MVTSRALTAPLVSGPSTTTEAASIPSSLASSARVLVQLEPLSSSSPKFPIPTASTPPPRAQSLTTGTRGAQHVKTSGLSKTAKIGLGVGFGVLSGLFFFACCFFIRWRLTPGAGYTTLGEDGDDSFELDGTVPNNPTSLQEVPSDIFSDKNLEMDVEFPSLLGGGQAHRDTSSMTYLSILGKRAKLHRALSIQKRHPYGDALNIQFKLLMDLIENHLDMLLISPGLSHGPVVTEEEEEADELCQRLVKLTAQVKPQQRGTYRFLSQFFLAHVLLTKARVAELYDGMSGQTKTLYRKAFRTFREAKTILGGSVFTFSLIQMGRRGDRRIRTNYRMRCIRACAFIAVKIPLEVRGWEKGLGYDYILIKQTLGIWHSEGRALDMEMVQLESELA